VRADRSPGPARTSDSGSGPHGHRDHGQQRRGGHRRARIDARSDRMHPGQQALQARQPRRKRGKHGRARADGFRRSHVWRQGRRRRCRPLRGRNAGTVLRDCRPREGGRRAPVSRRGVQAAHLTIQFSRPL